MEADSFTDLALLALKEAKARKFGKSFNLLTGSAMTKTNAAKLKQITRTFDLSVAAASKNIYSQGSAFELAPRQLLVN